MVDTVINRSSFKEAMKDGNGSVNVWDPVRQSVAKVIRSEKEKSFFIEPVPGEIYSINPCDAMIDWVMLVAKDMCRD